MGIAGRGKGKKGDYWDSEGNMLTMHEKKIITIIKRIEHCKHD